MDNDFQLTFDFDINKDNFIVNDLISKQIPEAGNPKQLSFKDMRRASLADYLYLAVPTDSVHPYEVADGWGLLYINKNLEVKLVKEPELWDCHIENKFHLVQNISSASLKNTLFTNGINMSKEGKLTFVRLPRRRRC